MNRLYKEAYNLAYDMAKMAEKAFQFEIDPIDSPSFFVANDNWQFDKAGLLAGQKLMLQLQKMEQAYLEGNVRTPEISQSFSLALLDASQLITLRQTGTCNIVIPEIAFEVLYPGQYKRLIKSVSLTIPCVAGPYTNISAKLTLSKAYVKAKEDSDLKILEVGKNTSITTSSANNDSGVFELNFRDERFLPFEGSGAISEWTLELPSVVRSFDYDTISDVILHMSYTALEGNRLAAEQALADKLTNYAADPGLFRLFSLSHEFPNAFHQLLHPQGGAAQTTEFAIEKKHFPYLFSNKTLNMIEAKIYLKPKPGETLVITSPFFYVNDSTTTPVDWNPGDDISMMPESNTDKDKIKGGTIPIPITDSPIKTWKLDAGINGLDISTIDDVLILVKYTIS